MMNFKKYILLLGSLLAFSCAPTVVPKSNSIPTPPTKTESVKPSLEKVKTGINKSIVETTKIEEKVKTQDSAIKAQKSIIEDALVEAKKIEEKLKAKQYVSEAEITSLKNKLEQIKKENSNLLENNVELKENVKYLSTILDLTRQDGAATANKLDQTEEELNNLRIIFAQVSTDLKNRNTDVEKMQKQVLASERSAATAKVYKYWVWVIVGIFSLWTIIKNVLMMYFPNTRFRI